MCVALAAATATEDDAVALADAFDEWVAGGPTGAEEVSQDGSRVDVTSCEPPEGTEIDDSGDRAIIAVQYPALRMLITGQGLDAGLDQDQALCFGNSIMDAVEPDQLSDPEAFDEETMQRQGAAAAQACLLGGG